MANPLFPGGMPPMMGGNNNPMTMLMQMIQGGKGMNPQVMFQMMTKQNPQFAQIMQGMNPNDSKSMEQMCKNICQQKGFDYDTMLAQFKNMK